jgi:hypothetical protein
MLNVAFQWRNSSRRHTRNGLNFSRKRIVHPIPLHTWQPPQVNWIMVNIDPSTQAIVMKMHLLDSYLEKRSFNLGFPSRIIA